MIYQKNLIVRIEKDWITDFTFDFSKEMTQISTFSVTNDVGILITNSVISTLNKVVLRLSGGTLGQKYNVTVSATSTNGEVRTMSVFFLMV